MGGVLRGVIAARQTAEAVAHFA
ncbi:MAG: hypothetical protein JWN54_3782, partial [Mycobacterium sp.]|nr:hypothetical protein [Mycobacterium sp.]